VRVGKHEGAVLDARAPGLVLDTEEGPVRIPGPTGSADTSTILSSDDRKVTEDD